MLNGHFNEIDYSFLKDISADISYDILRIAIEIYVTQKFVKDDPNYPDYISVG